MIDFNAIRDRVSEFLFDGAQKLSEIADVVIDFVEDIADEFSDDETVAVDIESYDFDKFRAMFERT